MTQEEKHLLLKDLCARLPYGVICSVAHKKDGRLVEEDMKLSGMFKDGSFYFLDEMGSTYSDNYIPYLRPMSSMTEDERIDYLMCCEADSQDMLNHPHYHGVDWLNANHFDYRGLIHMGLALEAPEDMYKF